MKRKLMNVSGTKEWAVKNVNFINGCEHQCKYCFACSMAVRTKRILPENWKNEIIREHDYKKSHGKSIGQIMFPSSHDITPTHLAEGIVVIKKILASGNDILIVSKPHKECIKKICKEFSAYKDNILFRFSIGSTDNKVLKFWEPGAPSFSERLKCLKYAYSMGFKTSVSSEPMIDFEPWKLVEQLSPYTTDSIWFGKANRLRVNLSINGYKDAETQRRADELIAWQSDEGNIRGLYNRFKNNPKVKWKESIKKVVGIKVSTEKGMDI